MYPPTDIAISVNNKYLLTASKKRKMIFTDIIKLIAGEIYKEMGIYPLSNTKYSWRELVLPRQIFMVMLYKYTEASLNRVGRLVDKKHSTVIYAKKTINNLIDTDREFAERFKRIEKIIKEKIDGNN